MSYYGLEVNVERVAMRLPKRDFFRRKKRESGIKDRE